VNRFHSMRLVVKLVRMIADLAGGELIAGNRLGEAIRCGLGVRV